MAVVLGIVWRGHADALRDMQAIGRSERVGLVLLGLEAIDISVVQHAGMQHILLQQRRVVVVLGVVRRRHADALRDMHAIGRPERVGLVLL